MDPRLPRNVLYYGREDPLPEQVRLQAGPLSMVFTQGALRYIRLGDSELLRGISVAVRATHWTTFPPAIADLVIVRAGRKFRAAFNAESQEFRWSVRIAGSAEGRITFSMETRQDRIGLCVLHPARSCAGRLCVIEKAGGAVEKSLFPALVSPQPPFTGLRAISHEIAPGLIAEVRFDVGICETEDLRNWTGASYQTCGAGTRQSVRLSVRGAVPERAERTARAAAVSFSFGDRATAMPALGLGLGSPLTLKETARVQALRPAHLRVELDFSSPGWPAALAEARAVGTRLEAALLLTGAAEEELSALARLSPPAARWLVFDPQWLAPARRRLAGDFIVGANSDFADLNRARPATLDLLDGACFAINPQMHASDNDTLIENLAPQASVLETARQFFGALPVSVTPVALKPREADPRQKSLFGAAWTVGSLKYLAQGGARTATFYETTGARGVMESEKVYPLYHVLADAADFQGGEALVSESSDPLALDGIVMRHRGRLRILLANFRPDAQNVRIATAALGTQVRLKQIDEINAESAMTAPEAFREGAGQALEITGHWLELPLAPYALLRIDAG